MTGFSDEFCAVVEAMWLVKPKRKATYETWLITFEAVIEAIQKTYNIPDKDVQWCFRGVGMEYHYKIGENGHATCYEIV